MTRTRTDEHLRTTRRGFRTRGGRRLLPALTGTVCVAALLTGCGAADSEDPAEETVTEQAGATTDAAEDSESPTAEEPTTEESAPDDGDDAGDDRDDVDDGDDATDDDGADDGGADGGDGAGGENLFEGTWGFGHDTKVLDAEELADLLEEQAEARGPEEMSLDVDCADGVDTGAGDGTAECTAYADEGVEHVWLISAGPADAGLEIEVENQS